jgi:hypothetical protein
VGDDVTNPRIANLGTVERPVFPFLAERTPEPLRNLVTCKGYQFGALLGLHRINQMFYNKAITERADISRALAEHNIDLAHAAELSLDVLPVLLHVLHEHGFERPLLISNDSTTWSRLLVENMMVAVAEEQALEGGITQDSYTAFWSELAKETHAQGHVVNMQPFNVALDRFEQLTKYAQYTPSVAGKSVLDRLSDETTGAVFTVTGDWEIPHMPSNLGVRPFPGTDNAYVYTADVAVVVPTVEPLDERHPMAGWLKAVTSSQAQTDYQRYKHSLEFLTFDNGRSRSKSPTDLFTVDGRQLRGYQGLPAYIPHSTFDELGSIIKKHMSCLVDNSDPSRSSATNCTASNEELRKYVFDQYCHVLTGSHSGCTEKQPTAGPQ